MLGFGPQRLGLRSIARATGYRRSSLHSARRFGLPPGESRVRESDEYRSWRENPTKFLPKELVLARPRPSVWRRPSSRPMRGVRTRLIVVCAMQQRSLEKLIARRIDCPSLQPGKSVLPWDKAAGEEKSRR